MLAQDKDNLNPEPKMTIQTSNGEVNVCTKHEVVYISECPTCAFEINYKKDKHSYRQFKNKGR